MPDYRSLEDQRVIDAHVSAGKVTVLPPAHAAAPDIPDDADYIFEIKVRNANILRAMQRAGIPSAAELARRAGVSPTVVGAVIGMKCVPTKTTGAWTSSVLQIADALNVMPDDLFSEQQRQAALATNRFAVAATEAEARRAFARAQAAALPPEDVVAVREASTMVRQLIDDVTSDKRKRRIMHMWTDGHTVDDIARTMGVSRARIRQVLCRIERAMVSGPHARTIQAAGRALGLKCTSRGPQSPAEAPQPTPEKNLLTPCDTSKGR